MKHFLPCGSPYHSDHRIGRFTSGLRPCCCYRGGRRFMSSRWVVMWNIFWINARMRKIRTGSDLQHDIRYTVFFRLLARANIRMKNCKRSHDLDPPIEAKMPHDNLDSIGRFKSYDHLQFCIPNLARASHQKNMVDKFHTKLVYVGLTQACPNYSCHN